MIDWSDIMDYYSGAPEPVDYDGNSNFNGGKSKNFSFILLIILAIVIAILMVVFFLTRNSIKPKYDQKDDNSYLSELVVSGGTLSPQFTKDNFKYTVVATSDYVSFSCKADSKKSKVQGCKESIEVTDKEIVHSIRVEAEDTNVSKYYITIVKGETEDNYDVEEGV